MVEVPNQVKILFLVASSLLLLQSSSAFSSAPRLVRVLKQPRISQEGLCLSLQAFDHDDNNQEEETSPLSDEELLLACRSYLQKKNKLGEWTEFEKRKEGKKRQQQLAKQSVMSGFFWDDPAELKYYRTPRGGTIINVENDALDESILDKNNQDNIAAEDDQLQKLAESSSKNKMSSSRLEQVAFDFKTNSSTTDNPLDQWSREFSSFPSEPSETRKRRSKAARKLWQDPKWREKWYQGRWGTKIRRDPAAALQTKRQKQAPAVSVKFLDSLEFKNLSEEEIAEAITKYTQANQKRAASRKKTLQERKAMLQGSTQQQERVPLDAFSWDRDPNALKEAQKRRSEKARKAYETRMQKQQEREEKQADDKKGPRRKTPSGLLPRDAMMRVVADLDVGKRPQINDVVLMAPPKKMPKRKDVLRRILLECFGLRGKCVEVIGKTELQFITNVTNSQLMQFVIYKLQQAEEEDEEEDEEKGEECEGKEEEEEKVEEEQEEQEKE